MIIAKHKITKHIHRVKEQTEIREINMETICGQKVTNNFTISEGFDCIKSLIDCKGCIEIELQKANS